MNGLDRLLSLFEDSGDPVQPVDARVAARLLYVDGLLHELFPRRRRSRLRWIAGGLAAAAVFAASLFWILPRAPEPIATLHRGAEVAPLHEGDEISAAASVRFPDGTRFDLGADTAIRVGAVTFVRRGSVEARVTPQPAGRAVVLATPHAEARVLGTTLRLAVGASTRLEVLEGKVRLTRTDGRSVEVAGGHVAVAGPGLELASVPLARGASFVARMAPNTWAAAPDTALRKVAPSRRDYPKIQGQEGPSAVLAKSGGAFDTRRNQLLVWGGGFIHYHGNEVYAFKVDELAWERLTDPVADPALNEEVNADGTPVSRDTYHGLAYIAHADRLFACGGVLAGRLAKRAELTWTFDPSARKWHRMDPTGTRPPTGPLNIAAYDPVGRKVWWGDENYGGNGPGLYSYDSDSNTWAKHASESLAHYGVAVDTRRHRLLFVGRGRVLSYDLSEPTIRKEVWQTAGGEGFVDRDDPGLDYDPVGDRFVGWAGGAVYVLDPESRLWRSVDAPGGPPPEKSGVFGRWRYVPSVDAFLVATDADRDVHFFKPGRP